MSEIENNNTDRNESLLLDHEYDGIREYDNPTPGWWHLIFIGSVLWGIVYFVFATWSPYYTAPVEAVAAAQAAEYEALFGTIGDLEPDPETLLTMMADPKWVAVARGSYLTNCRSCHAENAQGLTGPNLTDDRYKNVKVVTDIYDVISLGAGKGAMPAWGTRLSKNEVVLLSAYVASLRGQNLPGAEYDGEQLIDPWPEPGSDAASTEEPDAG